MRKKGFTFGVKLPVIGYMTQTEYCWWYGDRNSALPILRFIRHFGLAVPSLSIGYKF